MSANLLQGQVQVHIATVTPTKMVILRQLEDACDAYLHKSFSLDRRAPAAKKFGTKAIAIMRKFSEVYPEFLDDRFFAFRWIDVQKTRSAELTDTGVVFVQNKKGLLDAEALALFIQVMFQVFEMDDIAFVCPLYTTKVRGGNTGISDAICVQRNVIRRRDVLSWAKGLLATYNKNHESL